MQRDFSVVIAFKVLEFTELRAPPSKHTRGSTHGY